jgi:hypothetical protein
VVQVKTLGTRLGGPLSTLSGHFDPTTETCNVGLSRMALYAALTEKWMSTSPVKM